eukprot:1553842-Rhodomonas_salina.1
MEGGTLEGWRDGGTGPEHADFCLVQFHSVRVMQNWSWRDKRGFLSQQVYRYMFESVVIPPTHL